MFTILNLEVSQKRGDSVAIIEDMKSIISDSTATQKLEQTYFTHHNDLVQMARLLVDDISTANDVVQEAFMKALNVQPNFKNSDPFFYMKRAVMNSARSQLRKRQTSRKHLSVVPIEETNASAFEPEEINLPIDAQIIQKALVGLTQRQRECVVGFHSHDMSHKEIAKLLEISEGSVKTHLHRGLKKLNEALGGTK